MDMNSPFNEYSVKRRFGLICSIIINNTAVNLLNLSLCTSL